MPKSYITYLKNPHEGWVRLDPVLHANLISEAVRGAAEIFEKYPQVVGLSVEVEERLFNLISVEENQA